jgi:hypothetical protein
MRLRWNVRSFRLTHLSKTSEGGSSIILLNSSIDDLRIGIRIQCVRGLRLLRSFIEGVRLITLVVDARLSVTANGFLIVITSFLRSRQLVIQGTVVLVVVLV